MPHIMPKDGNGWATMVKEEALVKLINQIHFIESVSKDLLMLEMSHP